MTARRYLGRSGTRFWRSSGSNRAQDQPSCRDEISTIVGEREEENFRDRGMYLSHIQSWLWAGFLCRIPARFFRAEPFVAASRVRESGRLVS
jgi:hypothetical protein